MPLRDRTHRSDGPGVPLPSIVIFSPPFFAAMPRLAPRTVALAAPNGIQTQATWKKDQL